LTHNWAWLCEEETECRHKVFKGLAAWCEKSPDFPTATTRLIALYEALIQSEEADPYDTDPFRRWMEVAWSRRADYASKMPFYFEGKPLDPQDFELPKGTHAIEALYEACVGAEEQSNFTILTWDAALGQAIWHSEGLEGLKVGDPIAWFIEGENDTLAQQFGSGFFVRLLDDVEDEDLPKGGRQEVQSRIDLYKKKVLKSLADKDFLSAHRTALEFSDYCMDELKIHGNEVVDSAPWGLEQLLAFSNAFNVETWRNRWVP
jgi:hypothetical protein